MYTITPSLKQKLKRKFINNLKLLDLISSDSFINILNEISKEENLNQEITELIEELEKDYEDYIKGNRLELFNEHIQINEVS